MKEYTVKEISDMLGTNQETVRRWIRDGKLYAEQSSRKSGNIVTENSLNSFLKTAPKYAAVLAGGSLALLGIPGIIGGVTAVTSVVLSSLLSHNCLNKSNVKKLKIPLEETTDFINTSIRDCEKNIATKREAMNELANDIKSEQRKMKKLQELLEQLKSD